MRVLVTGAGGTIGGRLAELLAHAHEVTAVVRRAPPPAGLEAAVADLALPGCVEGLLDTCAPQAVIHCAAFSNADNCERDPASAERMNAELPGRLAVACEGRGVRLVSLSTDLVLDGTQALSSEDVPVGAAGLVYGRSKRRGEQAVLGASPRHVVVRAPLMIGRGHGERGTSSESVLWSLKAGRRLRLFTDQFRSPTDAESLADLIERLLASTSGGLIHAGGPERLSRYALAERVARLFGLDPRLLEAASADEQTPARPRDASLDSGRALRELGWRPRPLEAGLRESRLRPDAAATWAASP